MYGHGAFGPVHEYTVAVGVVESLQNFSKSSGRRVKSFRVFVGELSMLDIDVLREALEKLVRSIYHGIVCAEDFGRLSASRRAETSCRESAKHLESILLTNQPCRPNLSAAACSTQVSDDIVDTLRRL